MINASLGSVKADQNETLSVLPGHYDAELHRRFSNYRVESGFSLHQISRMIRMKERELTEYAQGSYQGDLRLIQNLLRDFLEKRNSPVRVREADLFGLDFALTDPAKSIWDAHQFAHQTGAMSAIVGPSGIGKTKVNEAYAEKHPSTILITCNITTRRPGNILRLIESEMGWGWKTTSTSHVLNSIIERLKGTKRLLIIDDAHFLCWESFEALRTIHDLTKVGISFAGQERLYEEMRGGKAYLYDQILSRITLRRHVCVVKRSDVKLIADFMCAGLDKECIDYLYSIACGQGRFRVMAQILKLAVNRNKEHGDPVDLDLLTMAASFLMVGE